MNDDEDDNDKNLFIWQNVKTYIYLIFLVSFVPIFIVNFLLFIIFVLVVLVISIILILIVVLVLVIVLVIVLLVIVIFSYGFKFWAKFWATSILSLIVLWSGWESLCLYITSLIIISLLIVIPLLVALLNSLLLIIIRFVVLLHLILDHLFFDEDDLASVITLNFKGNNHVFHYAILSHGYCFLILYIITATLIKFALASASGWLWHGSCKCHQAY